MSFAMRKMEVFQAPHYISKWKGESIFMNERFISLIINESQNIA